ncbi:hypothetical protein THAOC_02552 [Thalassiosira oceanica]|uniref:Uncharacterized protein n=1 Tax=Thalassiosira oceanica TaxID=159749 RepID=K0TFC2_THAOC|nr:hypothetical protein THAOC_02552 [Thalassiosira oceanica]|eukprot:EJK75719.1 hypothetical protein THAOC_02552 [Thalassiosira oceanica]
MSSSCNRSQLAGMPMSPGVAAMKETAPVMVRYMFEGGSIGQGRLCYMKQRQSSETTIRASDVVDTLSNDGVDLDLFYPCAYESEMSSGGWLPMEPAPRHSNPWRNIDSNDLQEITFDIADADGVSVAKRIDVKLVRRPRMESRPGARVDDKPIDDGQIRAELEHCSEALHAISSAVPCGRLPLNGFFGIGVVSPKTQENIGTLWRSAFQLGASLLFTIAGRYRAASADTLNVPARIPLIELDDWSSFVQFAAPKACEWVVIEMGGTALKDFQHPRNAIYTSQLLTASNGYDDGEGGPSTFRPYLHADREARLGWFTFRPKSHTESSQRLGYYLAKPGTGGLETAGVDGDGLLGDDVKWQWTGTAWS